MNFCQVVRLDVKDRVAHLENGKSVTYDKCLIATGRYMTSALLLQVDTCVYAELSQFVT